MRSSDNRVVLYQLRDNRKAVTWRLEGHRNGVSELAFAPGDKTLVSASWDGTIRFWSMANHQVALTLIHDGGPVRSVGFSTNGNLMATAGTGGKVILWPAAKLDDTKPSVPLKTEKR